jgi:hypothetical protein
VTNHSLDSHAGVGVTSTKPGHDADESGSGALIYQIIPGIEFIYGVYVMRIHDIHGSVIHAKRWYKILTQGTSICPAKEI